MVKTALVMSALLALQGCGPGESRGPSQPETVLQESTAMAADAAGDGNAELHADSTAENDFVTDGTEQYRGFTVDSVLNTEELGEIHYCVYIPESYDGSEAYGLYVTLPGYQGLYFQGAGVNIRTEEFAFEALNYNDKMIVLAPQLDDWGETSAEKTIRLTEYFLSHYNISRDQAFINGYSGGGETLSLVLDKRPELYTAALMCSSKWDGGYENITRAKTPVYFVIGESDEYYGAEPFRRAYEEIRTIYKAEGLFDEKIEELVRLDVKPSSYFTAGGVSNQHGGGARLFSRDSGVMGWLLDRNERQEE